MTKLIYRGVPLFLDGVGRSWKTVCDAMDCLRGPRSEQPEHYAGLIPDGPYVFCPEHFAKLEGHVKDTDLMPADVQESHTPEAGPFQCYGVEKHTHLFCVSTCHPQARCDHAPATRSAIPTDVDEALSNRYSYHAPKGDQVERYARIRAACLALARQIALDTPVSREQSTAFTALDTVMFNANAAIARNE